MNKGICEKCDCGDCAMFFFSSDRRTVFDCFSEMAYRNAIGELTAKSFTSEDMQNGFQNMVERLLYTYKSFRGPYKRFNFMVKKTDGEFRIFYGSEARTSEPLTDKKWKEYGLDEYTGIMDAEKRIACPYEVEHELSMLNEEGEWTRISAEDAQ